MPPQRQASTQAVDSAQFFQSRPQGCEPQSYAAPTKSPVNVPADPTAVDADGSIPTEMEILLTELRGAYGLRPRSSPATTAPTPTFTSVSATTPSEVLSVMDHVAPQVFGEMPGIAPTYCSGNHNQIQSSLVSNLSEQNLDGLPYHYGFDNLNSRSVFLADGTEHRYYVLPEEYPLEQAPQPMSLSAMKHIGVTTLPSVACLAPGLCSEANIPAGYESLSVHDVQPTTAWQDDPSVLKEIHLSDVSEEEKREIEQLLKCISKAKGTEQTSTSLNFISDILDYTQQQDDEKASVNVHQLRDPPLKVLVIHEKRNIWDPGALAFLVTLPKDGSTALTTLLFNVLRGVFEEVMLDIPPAKPPDRHGIADSSPQVILLKVLNDENSSEHTHFNFLSYNSKQLPAIQPIQCNCFSLEAIPSWQRGPFSLGNFAMSDVWCNTTQAGDKIFGGLNTAANSQKCVTLHIN